MKKNKYNQMIESISLSIKDFLNKERKSLQQLNYLLK